MSRRKALTCTAIIGLVAACSSSNDGTEGVARRTTGGGPRTPIDGGSDLSGSGGDDALGGAPSTNPTGGGPAGAGGSGPIGAGGSVPLPAIPGLPVGGSPSVDPPCRNAPFQSFDEEDGNASDEFVHDFYTDAYGWPDANDFVYGVGTLSYTNEDGDPQPGAIRAVIPFTREGEFISITDGFFDPVTASYTFSARIKLVSNTGGCTIEAAPYWTDPNYSPTQGSAVLLVLGEWVSVQMDLNAVAATMLGVNIQPRGACTPTDGGTGSAEVLVDSIMSGAVMEPCPDQPAMDGGTAADSGTPSN